MKELLRFTLLGLFLFHLTPSYSQGWDLAAAGDVQISNFDKFGGEIVAFHPIGYETSKHVLRAHLGVGFYPKVQYSTYSQGSVTVNGYKAGFASNLMLGYENHPGGHSNRLGIYYMGGLNYHLASIKISHDGSKTDRELFDLPKEKKGSADDLYLEPGVGFDYKFTTGALIFLEFKTSLGILGLVDAISGRADGLEGDIRIPPVTWGPRIGYRFSSGYVADEESE
ncbi:MAG: hypothetical protein ABEH38_04820 [Flavobacteriales bacterium]